MYTLMVQLRAINILVVSANGKTRCPAALVQTLQGKSLNIKMSEAGGVWNKLGEEDSELWEMVRRKNRP